MTKSEHQLLIHMFTQQAKVIAALTQALKSNDLLRPGDDLNAYDAIAMPSEGVRKRLELQVSEDYLKSGKILGVNDLPTPEELF